MHFLYLLHVRTIKVQNIAITWRWKSVLHSSLFCVLVYHNMRTKMKMDFKCKAINHHLTKVMSLGRHRLGKTHRFFKVRDLVTLTFDIKIRWRCVFVLIVQRWDNPHIVENKWILWDSIIGRPNIWLFGSVKGGIFIFLDLYVDPAKRNNFSKVWIGSISLKRNVFLKDIFHHLAWFL